MAGLLSRERTVARPGFNRWLVPPAALAIHLSIGMAYGFSVFWLAAEPSARHHGAGTRRLEDQHARLDVHPLLCLSRIVGGALRRLGRAGGPPQDGGGRRHLLGGRVLHLGAWRLPPQIWLLWLGSGVIGGCGLGLGYISPVSTLIKWFPDRRGMATGMAIMGFGGGAMIGAPLADMLMKHFVDADVGGSVADVRRHGNHLLHRDDGRGLRLSSPAPGLETGRMDAVHAAAHHDHQR